MVFSRFHRGVLTQALAAVLTLLVCGGSISWGHFGGDDRECDVTAVLHDHAAHRLDGGHPDQTPPADHCAICHLLRSLQGTVASRALAASSIAHTTAGRTSPDDAPTVLLALNVPSRAPPGSFTTL